MQKNELIKAIQQLIAKDRLEEAIEKLETALRPGPLLDDLMVQGGRLAATTRAVHAGKITSEAAGVNKTQIRYALLDLVESMQRQTSKKQSSDDFRSTTSDKGKKSKLSAEGLQAGTTLNIKVKQKASEAKLKNISAGEDIHIDIQQE